MNTWYAWAKLLPRKSVCNLATLWKLGYLKAPGTWGSAAGLIYHTVFFQKLAPLPFLWLLAATTFVAIGICGAAEGYFGTKDPGYIILDECVAIPLCFFPISNALERHPTWLVMLAGFALFRFFDILKPLGIKKIQNLPSGTGVVLDDIAAAAATCLVLHGVALWV